MEDEDYGKVWPLVYFYICFPTDKDLEKFLNQIKGEFQKAGGEMLRTKNLSIFEPKLVSACYRMLNKNNFIMFKKDFKFILAEVSKLKTQVDTHYKYLATPIP